MNGSHSTKAIKNLWVKKDGHLDRELLVESDHIVDIFQKHGAQNLPMNYVWKFRTRDKRETDENSKFMSSNLLISEQKCDWR
jgi:hypothetical protein